MKIRSHLHYILSIIIILWVIPYMFAFSSSSRANVQEGSEEDRVQAMLEVGDGGFVLAGWTLSASGTDSWLIKTNSTGNVEWNQTYGGTDFEYTNAMIPTADGGYALAGYTFPGCSGSSDFWLVKTDSTGNVEWNQAYGGTEDEYAYAMIQTADGGYTLAGRISFNATRSDMWLVKTNGTGNMEWNQTYGVTRESADAQAMIQTADGGYALAGRISSDDTGSDMWLVKTDGTGNMEWNQTYGGTEDEYAYAMINTTDGGYALTGCTRSYGAGEEDIWLVKTDSAGNMEWANAYGGSEDEYAYAMIHTADEGYALAGSTASYGAQWYDMWLVRTDDTGNVEWNQTYRGAREMAVAQAMIQTSDGGYALSGWISNYDFGSDIWLIKTDSTGNMEWNQPYGVTEPKTESVIDLVIMLLIILITLGIILIIGYTFFQRRKIPIQKIKPVDRQPVTRVLSPPPSPSAPSLPEKKVTKQIEFTPIEPAPSMIMEPSKKSKDMQLIEPRDQIIRKIPQSMTLPPFYCQLCEHKHKAGTPRMVCEECGRSICVDSFAEMTKVGRNNCPMCEGRLNPL